MSRKPGDWDCPFCDHLNFSRRDSCQRCGEPRPMSERPRDVEFIGNSSGGGGGGGGMRGGSYGFGGGGGGGRSSMAGFPAEDVRPGDWYCVECNAHNFASRTGCYKCGAFRDHDGEVGIDRRFDPSSDRRDSSFSSRRYFTSPSSSASSYASAGAGGGGGGGGFGRSVWKSGDWICPRTGCKEHNFANRVECFRCNARREPGELEKKPTLFLFSCRC
ncbi:RNA-binding protein FUS-like isoform X1 [Selaginella moellendorffii]|uniref:RNA-binding protein FUS-like isoform X1 n=1 Tax=Selaginella moellendorffii TaxID=88036 RepID=UPI000D1C33AC|nr:RNA-binding protein FUS-like isoform X1 [Selaginella moellendorffii]|eukprot:XP_024522118.1 RNA-binding protein FUS-like isoform X1 [Selaginella moellendorffii]